MSAKIANKPLQVGLDLDGVVLYNPARIIRPIIKTAKRIIFKQKKTKFFIPQSKLGELFWIALHKSSFFVASGLSLLETLVKNYRVEAYIITARFKCLEKDTTRWLKKINQQQIIKDLIINLDSQQPHQYKFEVVKKLDLDIFIEDNWDIVYHLDQKRKQGEIKTKTLWITNILDREVDYQFKHKTLKSALTALARYSVSGNDNDLMAKP